MTEEIELMKGTVTMICCPGNEKYEIRSCGARNEADHEIHD